MEKKIKFNPALLIVCCMLTGIFVGFKLGGIISWSWWLVFSPMFFFMGLVVFVIVLIIVLAIIAIKK